MEISIRNECESDFRKVEELTREAFWNLYVPGCDEHYLVKVMRNHPDFIPELDFVAEYNGEIIGNIMYTKSTLTNETNEIIDTITFGPVSVLPKYQRQGVGSKLIQHSIKIATQNGYKVILIYGHPRNYCKHGFKSSKDLMVSDAEGKYPFGLLALELEKGILEGYNWKCLMSNVYETEKSNFEEYDATFDFKEKEYKYSQEEFSIAIRAYLV
jgi:putative acetyltransferase